MSLPDEILKALPDLMLTYPDGPIAAQVAQFIAADVPNTRAALTALESAGRAKLVMRGRALHLVPADYPGRICIICRREFKPVAKKTVTCSHSCARHLAWQNPDMRARHKASVIASRQKPGFKEALTKRWRDHYAKPESRQKASEAQIKTWQDPTIKGRRLVSIDKAWESPERRAKQAERRLKDWQNPEFREKAVAAMRSGKRAQIKRRLLDLARTHPEMTVAELAGRFNRTEETVGIILRDARKAGLIGFRPGDGPRLRRKAERQIAA